MNSSIKIVAINCVVSMFVHQPALSFETPSVEQMRSMLPQLNRMIESNPNDSTSLCTRGVVYQQLGDPQSAVEDCSKALTTSPALVEAYCCRFVAYMQLKDYPHALKDAEDTVRLRPGAVSYSNRGAVYAAMNKFAQAILDYTKALHYDPSSVTAYDGLGEAAYRLHKYENAIVYCNRALYLDPKIMEALYYRGKSYEALGKKDLAKKDLDRARAAGYKPGDVFVKMER